MFNKKVIFLKKKNNTKITFLALFLLKILDSETSFRFKNVNFI